MPPRPPPKKFAVNVIPAIATGAATATGAAAQVERATEADSACARVWPQAAARGSQPAVAAPSADAGRGDGGPGARLPPLPPAPPLPPLPPTALDQELRQPA